MNPLYTNLGQAQNMNAMLKEFENFKRQFKGNPQEQVRQLLNSGRVSQEQYNQAVQMAQALQKIVGM